MVNRIFMLEDHDFLFPIDGAEAMIISLDPSISYCLWKNGTEYKILEDFYDEKKLRDGQREYFDKQLTWFKSFDEKIKEFVPFCVEHDIPLAKANYLRLKYFVDTVVIYSRILSSLFESEPGLREIVYEHKPYTKDPKYSIFNFKKESRKVFGKLLEAFCFERGVKFTRTLMYRKEDCHQHGEVPQRQAILKTVIKKQAKKILNYAKYKKFIPKQQDSIISGRKVLCMHAGSAGVDEPIRHLIEKDAVVFLKEEDRILREDTFSRKDVSLSDIPDDIAKAIKEGCYDCSLSLKNSEVVDWISDKCDFDVSTIILPYLETFVSRDCKDILTESKRMSTFMRKNNISYLFARGNTDKASMGSIIAARYLKSAKSVCLQHASIAVDMEVFGVFETETYDYLITSSDVAQSFFELSLKERYNTGCKAFPSYYLLRGVRSKNSSKRNSNQREKVVFLEKKFPEKVRCFNNMIYPLTWYFEFQKKIVDYFSQREDVDFIYKHASGQRWAGESILLYLKEKKFSNIEIFDGHFLEILNDADRVLMDHPSTALFEAASCRKPVMSLYADYYKIIPQAEKVFGNSLRSFSTEEEALSTIDNFLNTDKRQYIVNLSLEGDSFSEAFGNIIRDEGKNMVEKI